MGPAGCPGRLRPWARSHNAGGGVPEGGVGPAGGALGFPASFPRRASASRRWVAHPALPLVSARSGLETELSARSPSPWAGNGGERPGGSREACELEVGEEEGVGL